VSRAPPPSSPSSDSSDSSVVGAHDGTPRSTLPPPRAAHAHSRAVTAPRHVTAHRAARGARPALRAPPHPMHAPCHTMHALVAHALPTPWAATRDGALTHPPPSPSRMRVRTARASRVTYTPDRHTRWAAMVPRYKPANRDTTRRSTDGVSPSQVQSAPTARLYRQTARNPWQPPNRGGAVGGGRRVGCSRPHDCAVGRRRRRRGCGAAPTAHGSCWRVGATLLEVAACQTMMGDQGECVH
jgi:hypothetical protein